MASWDLSDVKPDPKPVRRGPRALLRRALRRSSSVVADSLAWHAAVMRKTHSMLWTDEDWDALARGDVVRSHAHHIVPRQQCRKHGVPEWDVRNGVPVSERRHERHHSRVEPITRSELPDEVFEFMAEHPSLQPYFDRVYPAEAPPNESGGSADPSDAQRVSGEADEPSASLLALPDSLGESEPQAGESAATDSGREIGSAVGAAPSSEESMTPKALPSGYYLGVPVLIVADHGDGWVTALWPDRTKPRKGRPFTYRNGEWWKFWRAQVRDGEPVAIESPASPLVLKPKPDPGETA